VLIQWRGFPEEDATWELVDEFKTFYPDFQLEDELFAQAGRDVMTGIQYPIVAKGCWRLVGHKAHICHIY